MTRGELLEAFEKRFGDSEYGFLLRRRTDIALIFRRYGKTKDKEATDTLEDKWIALFDGDEEECRFLRVERYRKLWEDRGWIFSPPRSHPDQDEPQSLPCGAQSP